MCTIKGAFVSASKETSSGLFDNLVLASDVCPRIVSSTAIESVWHTKLGTLQTAVQLTVLGHTSEAETRVLLTGPSQRKQAQVSVIFWS